jgi:ribose transport system substrate-binding protein
MRMSRKVVGCLVLLPLMLVLASGIAFGAGGQEQKASPAKPYRILALVLTMEHEFMQQVALGYKIPPADGTPVTVFVEDPKGSVEQEVSIIESYMIKGVDAIIGYPIDAAALSPVLKEAKKKGIVVVTEGNHAAQEDVFCGLDEKDVGLFVGASFVKWWKANRANEVPKIAILDIPKIPEPQKRATFFKEYLAKNLPQAVIVAQQDAGGSAEAGLTVTESILQAHPEVNFVYGINDSCALGGLAAVRNSNRGDIAVCGIDASDQACAEIKKPLTARGGGMAFSVATPPITLGKIMVESAVKVLKKQAVAKSVQQPMFNVDRSNVDQYLADLAKDKAAAAGK